MSLFRKKNIEHMLAGDCRRRRGPEIGSEHLQDGLERRDARHIQPLAGLLELLGQLLVDDGVEHDAGLFLDVLEHLHQLLFGADQRVDVLDGARILVLRGCRPSRRKQRFARGVRNQVKVEEALGFVHKLARGLWSNVDKGGFSTRRMSTTVSDGDLSTIRLAVSSGIRPGMKVGIRRTAFPRSSCSLK